MRLPPTETVAAAPAPKKTKPKATGAIFASQGIHGKQYRTRNPSSVDGSTILVEFEGFTPDNKILLRCFYQNTQEWNTVKVERDYILIPLKEGTVKLPAKTAVAAKVKANSPASLGTTTKKPVRVAWGIAFEKLGTKPDAPKAIEAFMVKEFPGRKTQWLKWSNSARILFNKGALGGNTQPKIPLPPFGSKRAAKVKNGKNGTGKGK